MTWISGLCQSLTTWLQGAAASIQALSAMRKTKFPWRWKPIQRQYKPFTTLTGPISILYGHLKFQDQQTVHKRNLDHYPWNRMLLMEYGFGPLTFRIMCFVKPRYFQTFASDRGPPHAFSSMPCLGLTQGWVPNLLFPLLISAQISFAWSVLYVLRFALERLSSQKASPNSFPYCCALWHLLSNTMIC